MNRDKIQLVKWESISWE